MERSCHDSVAVSSRKPQINTAAMVLESEFLEPMTPASHHTICTHHLLSPPPPGKTLNRAPLGDAMPTGAHSKAAKAGSGKGGSDHAKRVLHRTDINEHPASLAIIDQDQAVHASLAESMMVLAPGWIVDSFFDADEAIRRLPESPPRAAILDFCQSDHHGIHCARSLIRLLPRLHVIMHTARGGGPLVMLAVMAGAHGFLVKPQPTQEVVATVLRVVNGETVFCKKAQGHLATAIRQMNLLASQGVLSPREMEILNCAAQGMYQKEIADILRITPGTVHAHLARIYKKLDVHSADAAARVLLERSQQTPLDRTDGPPQEIS